MPWINLASIEANVWDKLDNNQLEFPEPQVRLVINEGLRRLNLLTAFSQNTVPVVGNTVANQLVYTTPNEIIIPMSVYVEERELSKEGSLWELSQRHRNWTVDTTATLGPTRRWAPIGLTQFVIHPMDAVGGRILEVQGVSPIVPLVKQNDVINLDNEFADIVVDYSYTRLLLKETGKSFQNAARLRSEMIRKLKTMTAWEDMIFPAYFLEKQLEPSRGR